MADLYTHILVGYVLATILSWHYRWITPPLVTVCMVGAALPDLNRIGLLIDDYYIEALLGIPFDWGAFHRIGGTFIVILIGALLVPPRYRRAVVLLLVLGAGSHYVLDLLLYKPSGLTGDLLWPITGHRFAIDGFYLSSDRWPAIVTTIVAIVVWRTDRRLDNQIEVPVEGEQRR